MSPLRWQFLPTEVVEEQSREERANRWRLSQNEDLASRWRAKETSWLDTIRKGFNIPDVTAGLAEQQTREVLGRGSEFAQGLIKGVQGNVEKNLGEAQGRLERVADEAPRLWNSATRQYNAWKETKDQPIEPLAQGKDFSDPLAGAMTTMGMLGGQAGITLQRGAASMDESDPVQRVKKFLYGDVLGPVIKETVDPALAIANIPFNMVSDMLGGAAGQVGEEYLGWKPEDTENLPRGLETWEKNAPLPAQLALGLIQPDFGDLGRAAGRATKLIDTPDTKRMYHGTAASFTKPDPSKFDAEGLYGPGYYLTDNTEIADSYAMSGFTQLSPERIAQIEDRRQIVERTIENIKRTRPDAKDGVGELGLYQRMINEMDSELARAKNGPNVRPVNVPNGLNLFNIDEVIPEEATTRIRQIAMDKGIWAMSTFNPTGGQWGDHLYERLVNSVTSSQSRNVGKEKKLVNEILEEAGFDGIRHIGGNIIPLTNAAGEEIKHNVTIVFPNSINKLQNAITGTQGGVAPLGLAAAAPAAGAVIPRLPGESEEDYQRRVMLSAGVGGIGAGAVAMAGLKNLPKNTRRMFHGTTNPFDKPNPKMFSDESLYGPGYYMTSNPKVASSYSNMVQDDIDRLVKHRDELLADAKAIEETGHSPHLQNLGWKPGMTEEGSGKTYEQVTQRLYDSYKRIKVNLDKQIAEATAKTNSPNVRPIDVPKKDVKLFDIGGKTTTENIEELRGLLERDYPAVATKFNMLTGPEYSNYRGYGNIKGNSKLHTLLSEAVMYSGVTAPGQGNLIINGNGKLVNEILQRLGYDGIKYPGGKMIPIRDEAGQPIRHTAVAIFPDSINKVKNAITGEPGGQALPEVASGITTAMGGAAAAVPQLPGESDEAYEQRTNLGKVAAGVGAAGLGVAGGRRLLSGTTRTTPPIHPAVDTLVDMYTNPPVRPPSGSSFEPGDAEKVRRLWVRAMSDNGVDAAKLQQQVLKNTGGKLSPDEMLYELRRLDPYKAAEVQSQVLGPALQKVGEDQPLLSAYMTLVHNEDVAAAMGKRAEKTIADQPLRKTKGEKAAATNQRRLKMYERYRDEAAAKGDAARKEKYDILIIKTRNNIIQAEERGRRQASELKAKQSAKASAKGATVAAERQFSGGLRAADTTPAVQAMEASIGPERMAAIREAAQTFFDFNAKLLQRKLDSGLISRERFDLLRAEYPHYDPTVILEYLDTEAQRFGKGRSLSVLGTGIKTLTEKGTELAREDPIVSTLRNAIATEALARRNEAFNAFVNLIERDPELQGIVQKVPAGSKHSVLDKAVTGFVDGDAVHYVVPDFIRNAVEQEMVQPIPAVTSLLAAWRAMVTSRNPAFLTANAFVDASTYMIRETTRGGGPASAPAALIELAKSYAHIFDGLLSGKYTGDLAEFLESGGGLGGMTNVTPRAGREMVAKLGRKSVLSVNRKNEIGKSVAGLVTVRSKDDLKRVLRDIEEQIGSDDRFRIAKDIATLKPVEALSERVEMAPRVAAYNLAKKRGANKVEAAMAGRTTTIDFAQGGYLAKTINSWVPFFNVGIQGGATLARTYKENPKAFVATALTTLVAPTLAAETWNRLDEQRAQDYEDVPQYLKDQGMVIMLPGEAPVDASGNRRPQFLHIRTREYSPIVMAIREATNRVMGQEGRSWDDLASGVISSVSPLQSADLGGIATQLVPPGVSTAIELRQDRDFYRNRRITSERADENASPISKTLAGALGGRPSQWQYGLKDLGGGPTQIALDAASSAAGQPSAQAGVSSIPVVGSTLKRFVRGDIGQNLDEARSNRFSPMIDAELKKNGIDYRPGEISSSIKNIPLRVEEQAKYQAFSNEESNRLLAKLLANPSWQKLDPKSKEAMVQNMVRDAHEIAASKVMKEIGATEIRKRLQGAK